ncbi:pseudouridine-5'-monophosphatase-like [Tropilaelaps mercedesae]|uniref:Pseudouridine-5'-monophosphatase-like n=1 Tax=Tropilaelaps mercedesae TaxID=418985 RepID=A0A1V9XRX6_9ACAR|nr:pseudouridine-5'-monophosphatase-like [Tropilaelaps mercedesae]
MASSTYKPVTHCIFDMDGLLLDSEQIYFECYDEVLKELGHRYTYEMANRLRGAARISTAKIVVESYGLSIAPDEFLRRLDAILPQKLANCRLMPGADRLVRHLHKHKVPIAIATGSSLEYVRIKTEQHQDFIKLFNHIVSGSDDLEVKESKPAPDVFLVCARRFAPPLEGPEACVKALVFEDAPNGVRAAIAAGMQVVMVPDPLAVQPEQKKEATLCIDCLEDFKPELFGLPPFDK